MRSNDFRFVLVMSPHQKRDPRTAVSLYGPVTGILVWVDVATLTHFAVDDELHFAHRNHDARHLPCDVQLSATGSHVDLTARYLSVYGELDQRAVSHKRVSAANRRFPRFVCKLAVRGNPGIGSDVADGGFRRHLVGSPNDGGEVAEVQISIPVRERIWIDPD